MTASSRAVLFDLDGTLLDSIPAFLAITRRACVQLGWPPPQPGYIREVMTLGHSPIEALLGPVDNHDALRRELTAASLGLWQEVFAGEARPFHDTLEVLQHLAGDGYRLGIVTDSNHFVVSQLTGLAGCPPIDVIITRDEAPARKPSPSGIELALQRLRLAPHAAVYIGDNPIDIQAAHGAGVRAFGITTGASLREDLLPHGPHAVLDSLSQLHAYLAEAPVDSQRKPATPATVRGELVSGLGEASGFLAVDWVREALEGWLGGPIYPGTVNLDVGPDGAALVTRCRHDPGLRSFTLPARDTFCSALLHAVELTHGFMSTPALLLWPRVPDYPDRKLELICPLPLRASWALTDGALLDARYLTVEEPWP